MSDLQGCRICLRTYSKFYSLDKYNLKIYYELISGISISENDNLLQYFCCECATLLNKFNSFRDKCHYSNEVLREWDWSGSISHKTLEDIVMQNNPILEHGKLTTTAKLQSLSSVPDVDMKQEFPDENDIYSDDNFENPNTNPVTEETDLLIEIDTKNDECNEVETEVSAVESPSHTVDQTVSGREEQKIKHTNQKSKIKRRKRQMSPTKSKRRKAVETGDSNPKGPLLNNGFSKKSTLSEKEAAKEFEAKSKDEKYLTAKFKCTDCLKGFSQKSMLDRHIPQRHGQHLGPLVCRFCKMRFRLKCFLSKHIMQHYTRYKCLRCDLVFNLENSASFHEDYHTGVVRKCSHCDKEFKHVSTYYSHLRTHRSKHMCTVCGESFVSQLGLRFHTLSKHTNGPKNQKSEDMFCEVCQIRFKTVEAYEKHLLHSAMHIDDSGYRLQEDDTTEETEAAGDHKDDKKDKIMKLRTARKSRVEKTLSAVIKRLPRRGRTSKKPTTCHQPGSIKAHNNQHTRSRVYTCDTCEKSFTSSSVLRNHLVTHTGEKKFGCTLCDKRFTQNGSLSLHYRTFHLKQPYPKRNRKKNNGYLNVDITVFDGKEE